MIRTLKVRKDLIITVHHLNALNDPRMLVYVEAHGPKSCLRESVWSYPFVTMALGVCKLLVIVKRCWSVSS